MPWRPRRAPVLASTLGDVYDLVIRNGLVVDGSGRPADHADVGVRGDQIVDVARHLGSGHREIDADGRLVTPGFVDIHTHYDAQVTWDPWMTPSSWHGVTTVVAGNCGVGFAPVAADRHDWLIELMEGVEDIPGSAMSEGITWVGRRSPSISTRSNASPASSTSEHRLLTARSGLTNSTNTRTLAWG